MLVFLSLGVGGCNSWRNVPIIPHYLTREIYGSKKFDYKYYRQ